MRGLGDVAVGSASLEGRKGASVGTPTAPASSLQGRQLRSVVSLGTESWDSRRPACEGGWPSKAGTAQTSLHGLRGRSPWALAYFGQAAGTQEACAPSEAAPPALCWVSPEKEPAGKDAPSSDPPTRAKPGPRGCPPPGTWDPRLWEGKGWLREVWGQTPGDGAGHRGQKCSGLHLQLPGPSLSP